MTPAHTAALRKATSAHQRAAAGMRRMNRQRGGRAARVGLAGERRGGLGDGSSRPDLAQDASAGRRTRRAASTSARNEQQPRPERVQLGEPERGARPSAGSTAATRSRDEATRGECSAPRRRARSGRRARSVTHTSAPPHRLVHAPHRHEHAALRRWPAGRLPRVTTPPARGGDRHVDARRGAPVGADEQVQRAGVTRDQLTVLAVRRGPAQLRRGPELGHVVAARAALALAGAAERGRVRRQARGRLRGRP